MPNVQDTFALAQAGYHRAAAACDRSWDAYRKARAQLEKRKGVFAAEQRFIDASQAVGRAQDKLAEKDEILRKASAALADLVLSSKARAVIPFRAPAPDERRAFAASLAQSARLAA